MFRRDCVFLPTQWQNRSVLDPVVESIVKITQNVTNICRNGRKRVKTKGEKGR